MAFKNFHFDSDQTFNNADSFAFSFDECWKKLSLEPKNISPTKEEKIKMVLTKLEDHPFLKMYPTKAIEIAHFRVKLLNLK